MGDLMNKIYDGCDSVGHIKFEAQSPSAVDHAVRGVFIARICRAICLLGYNLGCDTLKDVIKSSIHSLQKEGRTYYEFYRGYVQAKSWESLAQTMLHSMNGCSMDPMVHLSRKPTPPPARVRRVIYANVEDIPRLLQFWFPFSRRASANDCIPKPSLSPESTVNDQDSPADTNPSTIDHLQDPETEELQLEPEAPTFMLDDILEFSATYSAEEIKAVTLIQNWYRRVITRRRDGADTQEIEQPDRSYKLLYRGSLPHIRHCLKLASSFAQSQKKKLKKRLTEAEGMELSEVEDKMTEITALVKRTKELQSKLGPYAEVHRRGDVSQLKVHVIEVKELINELPPGCPENIWDNLNIGFQGIVQEAKVELIQSNPNVPNVPNVPNIQNELCEV